MKQELKDVGQLIGSTVGLVLGGYWLYGRLGPETLTFVPIPLAVIIFLSSVGGAFFATWRLATAEQLIWKLCAGLLPLFMLVGLTGFVTSTLTEKSRTEDDALAREVAEELYLERKAAEQQTEQNAP